MQDRHGVVTRDPVTGSWRFVFESSRGELGEREATLLPCAVLERLGTDPARTLFVAGSASDVPGARGVGMPVFWHNRVGLPPLTSCGDLARPEFEEKSLEPLPALF